MGGIFKVSGDATSARRPSMDEARRALHELKGYRCSKGYGMPPADVDSLGERIMNGQRLAFDLGAEVRELDINPLVVRPRGAVALDALVVRK